MRRFLIILLVGLMPCIPAFPGILHAVDSEKFIVALAGLTLDSPVGNVTVREYDHQLMLPMFVGVTKTSPDFDFLIAGDIETIPADRLIMSIDEVKKAREQ